MTVREVGLRGGVGEELAAVGSALARFVSRPRGERPGEVVRGEMVGWRRLIDRMELEFAGMVTELAACGEVEWVGHNSPTDWVKEECHLTGTAAWNALVVGEQAARMPESTRALVAGEIGYAHLALMARTADWVGGLPVVAVDLLAAGRPDATAPDATDPETPPTPMPPRRVPPRRVLPSHPPSPRGRCSPGPGAIRSPSSAVTAPTSATPPTPAASSPSRSSRWRPASWS